MNLKISSEKFGHIVSAAMRQTIDYQREKEWCITMPVLKNAYISLALPYSKSCCNCYILRRVWQSFAAFFISTVISSNHWFPALTFIPWPSHHKILAAHAALNMWLAFRAIHDWKPRVNTQESCKIRACSFRNAVHYLLFMTLIALN